MGVSKGTRATKLCHCRSPRGPHLIKRRDVQDVLRTGLAMEGDERADLYLIICRKQPGIMVICYWLILVNY